MGCKKLAYYQYKNHSLRVVDKNPTPFPEQVETGKSHQKVAIDYYPGGMLMPGRNFMSNSYAYGYNGKRMDNEVFGKTGSWYDYGERPYMPLIMRFPSPDPLIIKKQQYPELSSYQYASNNPIWNIDLDGLEGIPAKMKNDNSGYTTALDNSFKPPGINPASIQVSSGSIKQADAITTFEMWLGEPSSSIFEGVGKIGLNIGYGMINAPFSLITGQTIGGHVLNTKEKTDAFVDVVPGLLTGGLTKTRQVIKTTEKGLGGYNQFLKGSENVSFKGISKELPEGMKWQTRAGDLFQKNKVSQQGLKDLDKGLGVKTVGNETQKEIEK